MRKRTYPQNYVKTSGFANKNHTEATIFKMRKTYFEKIYKFMVPDWVPNDLLEEFFEWGSLYGEFAAAAHIRKLKRGDF